MASRALFIPVPLPYRQHVTLAPGVEMIYGILVVVMYLTSMARLRPS
jgi:hypothetical protein